MVYPLFTTFRSVAVILFSCVVLVACAHEPEVEVAPYDVAERIDLTTGKNVERMRDIVEGQREIMNLSVLSNKISDGRVRVYEPMSGSDLLIDAPSMDQVAEQAKMRGGPSVDVVGVQVSNAVTIFPLEGVSAPVQPVGVVSVAQSDMNYIAVAVDNGSSLKVHFDHNSAFIRPASQEVLDRIAQDVQGQAGGVSIEGHASRHSTSRDPTRRMMGNLKISMNRAYNVAQELVRRGVPAGSIRLVGWGETQLPSVGADGENARRVEVSPFPVTR